MRASGRNSRGAADPPKGRNECRTVCGPDCPPTSRGCITVPPLRTNRRNVDTQTARTAETSASTRSREVSEITTQKSETNIGETEALASFTTFSWKTTLTPGTALTTQQLKQLPPQQSTTRNPNILGISIELLIVSAVAGLCLLCAIVAIAVACHLKKKYKSNNSERNTQQNKQSPTYIPIGEMPRDSAYRVSTDSIADNPTYAEIGEFFGAVSSTGACVIPTAPPEQQTLSDSTRTYSRERLTSATLPLLPNDGYTEYLKPDKSPAPPHKSYEDLNLQSVRVTRNINDQDTLPLTSNEGYTEYVKDEFPPPHRSYEDLNLRNTNKEAVERCSPQKKAGYVDVDYSTSETDEFNENHNYITVMPTNPADKKGTVDADYSKVNKNVKDKTAMSLQNSQDLENVDKEDSKIPANDQNESPLYFTVGTDHCQDLPEEVVCPDVMTKSTNALSMDEDTVDLKNNFLDGMSKRQNYLDLSVNEKIPHTIAGFGKGVASTDVGDHTNDEHADTCGRSLTLPVQHAADESFGDTDAYQQIPLVSPRLEENADYQKLDRGFMTKTVRK